MPTRAYLTAALATILVPSLLIAKDKSKLDSPEAEGTFELDKDQMTLTFSKGEMCPADQKGTYKVVISRVGIRFTKVEDDCANTCKKVTVTTQGGGGRAECTYQISKNNGVWHLNGACAPAY